MDVSTCCANCSFPIIIFWYFEHCWRSTQNTKFLDWFINIRHNKVHPSITSLLIGLKTHKKNRNIISQRGFNIFYLYYLFIKYLCIIFQTVKSPSSRGLGHCPFTAATGVRIPLGTKSSFKYTLI